MKTLLEPEDIEQVAQRVVELISQVASTDVDRREAILDKKDLSEYLKIDISWINKHLDVLPHFKAGKYVRFRRSSIDDWAKAREKTPSQYLQVLKGRK